LWIDRRVDLTARSTSVPQSGRLEAARESAGESRPEPVLRAAPCLASSESTRVVESEHSSHFETGSGAGSLGKLCSAIPKGQPQTRAGSSAVTRRRGRPPLPPDEAELLRCADATQLEPMIDAYRR